MKSSVKTERRTVRRRRIRAKVKGTLERPRLAVFRSNKALYAQLIDDERGVTLASARSSAHEGKPVERAKEAGKALAEAAKKQGITRAVFDRGGYIYTGQVRTLAEGAREGGLEF